MSALPASVAACNSSSCGVGCRCLRARRGHGALQLLHPSLEPEQRLVRGLGQSLTLLRALSRFDQFCAHRFEFSGIATLCGIGARRGGDPELVDRGLQLSDPRLGGLGAGGGGFILPMLGIAERGMLLGGLANPRLLLAIERFP